MELEMKTEGKKLEFYTGRWVSFLPFIIFLGMIIRGVGCCVGALHVDLLHRWSDDCLLPG